MRKVLIVSYYFNDPRIIGSVRMRGLSKYLPRFGWEPIVLTRAPPEKNGSKHSPRVIAAPSDDILEKWKTSLGLSPDETVDGRIGSDEIKKKTTKSSLLNSIWTDVFGYPDLERGWIRSAIHMGSMLIEKERFDAILSSSYPPTSHLVARSLSLRHRLPWIADMRDLWTQNPGYNHGPWRRLMDERLELKTLADAKAITTVSDTLASALTKLHKTSKIHTIFNGFDPEEFISESSLDDKFNIVYTGSLYQGVRDPEPLFEALSLSLAERTIDARSLSVDFYGRIERWILADIRKYGLGEVVHLHGLVSREESIAAQKSAQMLLQLTWNYRSSDKSPIGGIVTGKIFEYLAARRPIISIGVEDESVTRILNSTNAGVHISSVNDIRKAIEVAYDEYRTHGCVSYNGVDSEILEFTHIEMAKRFSGLLDSISAVQSNL